MRYWCGVRGWLEQRDRSDMGIGGGNEESLSHVASVTLWNHLDEESGMHPKVYLRSADVQKSDPVTRA